VPAAIRKLLGLKPKDRVAFEIVDGTIIFKRPRFTLETLAGSVKPRRKREDFETMAKVVREERVERQMRILRGE
jgi:bifunctional DNA-binding transcriptional regulator/antitoxin component of YhaV-PrlF toxin-antitoxin module